MTEGDPPKITTELLRRRIDQIESIEQLAEGGGGGHTGGMDDTWAQSVETRLGNLDTKIDRNFVITWGGIIALGLLGIGGFVWMINILLRIERELGGISATLATLAGG